MGFLMRLGSQLQRWLEGDDPFYWESQNPTVNEMARLLERYSLSSQLPYVAFDAKSQVYHNQSTVGFMVECSPLVGANGVIQKTLSSLFTTAIPEGAILQVLLYASPKIAYPLDAYCHVRAHASPIHQASAKALTDYLKGGAVNPLTAYDKTLVRDFKIYVSLSLDNEFEIDALYRLSDVRAQLITSLENAHINSRPFPPHELIALIRELNEGHLSVEPESIAYLPEQNLSQQMVSIETQLLLKRNRLQMGNALDVRVLAAEQFPRAFVQADMQEVIGSSLERGGMGCPFLLAFNFYVPPQASQQTRALFKSTRWGKLARGPLRNFVPLAEDIHQDWVNANRRMGLGDKFVLAQFLVALYARPDNANHLETFVKNHFGSLGFKLKSTGALTFPAWLSCLPFRHHKAGMQDAMDCGLAKTVMASNGASLAPFQGEWKGNGAPKDNLHPVLLLVGRKGQLMTWTPFDNQSQGGNFNIAIAGKPGSGKSFVMQMIEQSLHGMGGQIWVIDEGRSHQKTCELLEGRLIDFTEESLCLNPFTHLTVLNDKQMALLKPMVSLMATQKRVTTELEESFIEQAIQETWKERGPDNNITAIAHWLKKRKETLAQELGQMLFPYTKDGMYGRFVEGKATLDFENPFTLLELSGLKERPDLQPTIMLMFMHQINQTIEREARNIPKLLSIDEGWRHLFTHNTAKFLNEIARTIRKHGGSQMIGTQGISDFFSNPTGISIFENSDWTLLLKQKPESIKALKNSQRINMDAHMEEMLESLTVVPGSFSEIMIYGPEGYTIGRFMVDKFTRVLYSSSPKEYEAVNTFRGQGLSLIDAVKQVADLS